MFNRKNSVKFNQLQDYKITVPENSGKIWQGIEHEVVPITIMDEIRDRDMFGVNEHYYHVTPNGQNLVGNFTLGTAGTSLAEIPGWEYCLGVLTNNERRRATCFYYGLTNANRLVSIVFGKIEDPSFKNTTVKLFSDVVSEVMDVLPNKLATISKEMKTLGKERIGRDKIDHLLAKACRIPVYKGGFLWSKLGLVDKLLHNKNYLLTVLSAGCQVINTCPTYRQMDMKCALKDILMDYTVAHEKAA